MTAPARSRPARSRSAELAVLTGSKAASNTALRWVGPFLPTLERAFGSSTGALTSVIGACELGGLTTAATGRWLDRGNERRIFLLGTLAVVVSSVIALGGSLTTFAISYALVIIGVGNLTAAGHAWIGHRVAFHVRGRAIGAFETSWAIALLVGAPALAVLIETFGWRASYVALAIAGAVGAVLVAILVSDSPPDGLTPSPANRRSLPRTAWPPIIASAATSAAGLGTFVVSGAWLDDAYGVPTAGLGLIAAAFGLIELVSSTSVATIGDRVGTRRSVMVGQIVLIVGVAMILFASGSKVVAIAGLLVLLGGFEYAFVSSLTLVTEAAPAARGRAIGLSNAVGTVVRAGAVVGSGQLYEAFGMSGSLALAGTATLFGLAMTIASTTGR